MGDTIEGLGEQIREVVLQGNMHDFDLAVRYVFPNVVVLNVNVLRMSMTLCADSRCDGRGVISI